MNKRYFSVLMAVAASFLLLSVFACTVESVFSLDDLTDLDITEETTAVYAYSSGDQTAYEIYDETITVYDSESTSLGDIEDGKISNGLGTWFDIAIDDDTLTISSELYDPLIYTRV